MNKASSLSVSAVKKNRRVRSRRKQAAVNLQYWKREEGRTEESRDAGRFH